MASWATSVLAGALIGAAPALAQAAPTCVPATLNNSALLDGAVTVSPLPGSRDASPQTQISFLGVPARSLSVSSVVGSRTGAHRGRLIAYSQGDGASFVPSAPFAEGERVTVRGLLRTGPGAARPLLDVFAIANQDAISTTPEPIHAGTAADVQSFHSRPDLHPPAVTVSVNSATAAAGQEFVAPYTGPGQAGPMILAQDGSVVWFKPLPQYVSATNFRVQEYAGKPVLTWWQGDISVHGFGLGNDVILDAGYNKIAQVKAGNGLQADLHEFQLTPRGTALITIFDPLHCNLSAAGAQEEGAVTDGVFQEIDVRTGLVRLQWTSLDHVGLDESYEHAGNSSTAWPFDFFHINSLNRDADGGVLVSARNTWAVYDIDGRTGQVVWRLGGKKSSFSEAPGTRTAWQHDPRVLADGTISVFDNGSSPRIHAQSRGIVLSLDQQAKTATLVSQFTHPPALVADSQGNFQALANGDWFLGWGQVPAFSELAPDGKLLFDAHLPHRTQSYRSFRFNWAGRPAHGPVLAFTAGAPGAGTAYASWNGASLVAAWRLLAGPDRARLQTVAQVARSGFETPLAVPAGTHGPYLAVQALDASGAVLGGSAAAAVAGLP